jgi:hypothetical protein
MLQLQLASILNRRGRILEQEIDRLRKAKITNCLTPSRTAPASQFRSPAQGYSTIRFGLLRREVGRPPLPFAALFSHSLRSAFISAIIASSFLGSRSLCARSCNSSQPSGSLRISHQSTTAVFLSDIAPPRSTTNPLCHSVCGGCNLSNLIDSATGITPYNYPK